MTEVEPHSVRGVSSLTTVVFSFYHLYELLMMATTHALAGGAIVVLLTRFAPEMTLIAVTAALAGGVFPDLDLYGNHRRTLHFPIYYWIPVALAVLFVMFVPTVTTVAIAAFLLAAAVHSTMDIFGGGLELRPWLGTSDRAVYNHYQGHWIHPRRWIPYDGAPADFLLGAIFAVPVVAVTDGPLRAIVLGAVAVSGVYALLRKRLPDLATILARTIPRPLRTHIPDRFTE